MEDDHPNYTGIDGALFTKDKKTLLCVPGGKTGEYSVPYGVTKLDGEVFAGCNSLTGVVLPKSIKSLADYTFWECNGIKSVTIPAGVTSIGKEAFTNCDSLTDIYYEGTQEQWNAITKGSGNDALATVKVWCNSVMPESGVEVSGTALSWNSTDDAVYKLYPSTVEDSVIRSEWQSGTYTNALDYAATKGTPTASGGQYAQTFAFSDVESGSYKLAIFKPGKYAPKIMAVTVGDSDCDVGDAKLWLYGDVNGDGAIRANDAAQATRYVNGLASIFDTGTEQDKKDRLAAADLIVNNKILANDAAQITRRANNLTSVIDTFR